MRTRSFALLTAVTMALVGAVWYTAGSLRARHTTLWVMKADEPAGTVLTAASVRAITVDGGNGDLSVPDKSPVGQRLAVALTRGTPVSPGALLSARMVPVPISFKAASPGLVSGDRVDIYGPSLAAASTSQRVSGPVSPAVGAEAASGQGVQLYARGALLDGVGDGSDILVPASMEGWWTAVSTSGIALTAIKSSGLGVPGGGHAYTLGEALQVLAQAAESAAPASAPGP